MKIKLDYLIFLSIFATIGIIAFQMSWLKTSYQISRDKIGVEAREKLEQAVKMHEESVAVVIRKRIINLIKSNPHFYIKIDDPFGDTQVGFDGPNGKINSVGPLFRLTKEETVRAKKDSYSVFISRIGRANTEELSHVLDYVSPLNQNLGKNGRFEILKLFDFRRDTTALRKILEQLAKGQHGNFNYKVRFFEDVNGIFGKELVDVVEYVDGDSIAFDPGVFYELPSNFKSSIGEKLHALGTYINNKNKADHSIYIAYPLFNVESILNDRNPLILLTIDPPLSYVLSQMLFSLIGSVTLLLLVGFCLIYMFYTILKQKRLSEIKDDFISNVSHELKTPVATTLAAIQGMQHFDVLKDEEKTAQYLGTAAKEMKRLSTMIDTILNSAIYERSDFELHEVKFNLKEMLMEMISIQESHSKKEVKIELDYLSTEEVLGDKTHLYNVFTNLIDNAIKYGNENVRIKMECSNTNRGIKIQIADNGKGIPLVYQKNIFEKFFRVPSPTDHRIKGHGLGLNYVKNILEKHKGTIILLKSDGDGSIFEINLPQ